MCVTKTNKRQLGHGTSRTEVTNVYEHSISLSALEEEAGLFTVVD